MTTPDADVLVIGAGSAGLSAALMLARSRRRVLVLDGGPPRNAVAAHMHGVLGRDGWSPIELLQTGRDEIARYGAEVEPRRAVTIDGRIGRFTVGLETGDLRTARRVLFAGGLVDELPDVPGLAQHWGRGVAHCPYCDGWEIRDGRIAVLATGDMSIHQAQLLRQLTTDVTYLVQGTAPSVADRHALTARCIAVESRQAVSVIGEEGRVAAVRLSDGTDLPVDAVFVRPRAVPADDLLHTLGATSAPGIDDHDWIVVDPTGRTSIAGVWAAGNIVNPGATVPVASAAGSMAGAAINADLVEEEVRIATGSSADREGTTP